MPDQPVPAPEALESSIHELARVIRDGGHLEPEAQQALADLVDELSKTLHTTPIPAEEMGRLAESTAHLAWALSQPHEKTLLRQARKRLETTVAAAQVKAPLATGVTQRLLDILANLGI